MATQHLADMTLDDLKSFVDETVECHIQELLKPQDKRTVREINAAIRWLRWTPPVGAPSNLDLLREDRDACF